MTGRKIFDSHFHIFDLEVRASYPNQVINVTWAERLPMYPWSIVCWRNNDTVMEQGQTQRPDRYHWGGWVWLPGVWVKGSGPVVYTSLTRRKSKRALCPLICLPGGRAGRKWKRTKTAMFLLLTLEWAERRKVRRPRSSTAKQRRHVFRVYSRLPPPHAF